MVESKTRSISLNAKVVDEIEKYIEETGKYASIAEFVNEAARTRLEELQRTKEA